MAPNLDGYGLSTEVSLAVPPASIGFWSGRLQRYGVPVGAAEQRFGEHALPIRDPCSSSWLRMGRGLLWMRILRTSAKRLCSAMA